MKPPKNYSASLSLKTLADGYCKSINNSRRLIDDGEILIKCRRFLGAMDFFRLAVEELAKAFLITQAVVLDDDDADNWKRFWDAFHNHKKKLRILEYEFHWTSSQNQNEFHERVKTLLEQREESIYVQYDANNKAFLRPEDFFKSEHSLERYALNELKYALGLFSMFILAGMPTPDLMLKVFKSQKESNID